MENSNKQKILGLIIDCKFNFKSDINELCKKAPQKIGVLCRLSSYLKNYQKEVIFKSIIKIQFNYFSLVRMLCSRTVNNMSSNIYSYLGHCEAKAQKNKKNPLLPPFLPPSPPQKEKTIFQKMELSCPKKPYKTFLKFLASKSLITLFYTFDKIPQVETVFLKNLYYLLAAQASRRHFQNCSLKKVFFFENWFLLKH